jgi:carboxylesterase type B
MGGNGVVFGPNVDGFVLPETMMSLVRSGKQNQIPVIVGSTRDEFVTIAPLMLPSNVTTEEEYRATITKLFSSISQTVSPDAIYRAYPSSAYPSRNEALIEMMSDYVYTCPARMLSATFSRTHKAPVRRFIYTHTFSSPGWGDLRAAHGFELTYLFGPLPQQLALQMNNGERSLSNQMVRGWVDFADGKAPQTFGVDWPVYDPVKDNYLALDTPPRLESGFRQSQCDFWKQYEAELYP